MWVYCALSAQWRTSLEITAISGVSPRTARRHLLQLTQNGVAKSVQVRPTGFLYQLNAKRKKKTPFENRILAVKNATGENNEAA